MPDTRSEEISEFNQDYCASSEKYTQINKCT